MPLDKCTRYILSALLMLFITAAHGQQGVTDTIPNGPRKLEAGIRQYQQGNFEVAVRLLTETVAYATQVKSDSIRIRALNNLGNVYADKGNNPLSLQYYQQALQIAEAVKDNRNIAHIEKNIGALYISWKQFDQALSYYDRAMQKALQIQDSSLVADCYNNKGTVYEQQGKLSEAIDVYQKAMSFYESAHMPDGVAMVSCNIAIVYKTQKNYKQSLVYNQRALQISEQIGDKWMTASILNNTGYLFVEMRDYKNAIDYCKKSLALAQEIKAPEIIVMAYETLALAAAGQDDYRNAFAYQKKFAEAKDQFINTESTKQLQELQVKYNTQKKDNENRQLKLENVIKTAQAEKEHRDRILILIVSLIVVAAAAVIFILVLRNSRSRERHRQQQLVNKTIFETEQQERYRIARDLHDSVGQKLSVVKMQLSSYPAQAGDVPARAGGLLDEAIQEVRNISHNLIPEELNFGLVRAIEELADNINATSACKATLDVSQDAGGLKLPRQFELPAYRIVQETVGNMLRHSGAAVITINVRSDGQNLLISLADNGKGFDVSKLDSSTGIGWKSTQARVGLLNGKISVSSQANKGTNIDITLPYGSGN